MLLSDGNVEGFVVSFGMNNKQIDNVNWNDFLQSVEPLQTTYFLDLEKVGNIKYACWLWGVQREV